jgi:hypothetical protein
VSILWTAQKFSAKYVPWHNVQNII